MTSHEEQCWRHFAGFTNFELWLAMLNAGWKIAWYEKTEVHKKLKKRLAKGRTVVHCSACSRLVFVDDVTLEHIVPLSLGGTYDFWNLTLTCGKCNSKRGNMYDFWEWRVRRHTQAQRLPRPITHLKWHP